LAQGVPEVAIEQLTAIDAQQGNQVTKMANFLEHCAKPPESMPTSFCNRLANNLDRESLEEKYQLY
jgi:hypothetical protein